MVNFWLKVLLFLVGTIACVNSAASAEPSSIPWAHSYYHLKLLAKEEAKVIELLNDKKHLQNYQSIDIQCYMDDYEESATYAQYKLLNSIITDKEDLKIEKIVADNPILIYRMLRRIIHLVKNIVPKYSVTMKELNQHVQLMKRSFDAPLPTQTELTNSIDNILRIVLHYNLDVELFATKGLILLNELNYTLSPGFTRDQMIEIGEHALRGNLFTEAIHWYNAALKEKVKGIHPCIKHTKTSIENLIAEAEKVHDEFLSDGDFGFLPAFDDYANPYRYFQRFNPRNTSERLIKMKEIFEQEYLDFRHPSNRSLENDFEYLCNGKLGNKNKDDASLSCWYQYTNVASLIPYKIELHSNNVIQVYDLISPQITSFLTHNTLPSAARQNSTKTHPDGMAYYKKQKIVPEGSTESDTFVQKNVEIESFLRIEKILNSVVGELSRVQIPESGHHLTLRVESFGAGGYNTHEDNFKPKLYKNYETVHLINILYYLTDVSIGGQTIFLDDEIAVNPVKGSALLWRDDLNVAECPVVLGHKMTALKILPVYKK